MDDLVPQRLSKGQFLIASPEIESGLFSRGVLLLCEHSHSGSFALLINKPLDFELPEEIVDLAAASNKNISLRAGGPVQTNQMMLLHTKKADTQQLLHIADTIYLGGDLPFLHELAEDEENPHVYLCFGYAGWAGGQLEKEHLDGSWFSFPATSELLFRTPPERLWQTLLMNMGGKYASLSTIPEDLSLN